MNPLIKAALSSVAPMLNRLVEALISIQNQYGVKRAILMVDREPDPTDPKKEVAVLRYMHIDQSGRLVPIRDNNGAVVKFGVDKMLGLITGGESEEEED